MKNLSKDESFILKSLALLIMFAHHLFGNADEYNNFTTIIPGFKNIIVNFGMYFQICVGTFIFLSGVGMFYANCDFKSSVKRIFKLYSKLWIVMFFICIPIMLACGKFQFDRLNFSKTLQP